MEFRNKQSCRVFIAIISIIVLWSGCNTEAISETKRKVTLFPFNDLAASKLDIKSTSIVAAELAKNSFIELVPAEVVRKEILTINPDFLWTEKKGGKNTGSIPWRIQPAIVKRISRNLNSDYSIFGDISLHGKKWEVKASIADSDATVLKVFTIAGKKRDEMPKKLSSLGRDIAGFFKRDTIVETAEEEVRRYLGRLDDLSTAVGKIESMSATYPDLLPLRAILLDLYMRDKEIYNNKIIPSAAKIIELYNPSNGSDTRYLLSRYLDPYDVLANEYEKQGAVKRAIEIRERALREFPFFSGRHKKAIEALKGGDKVKESGGR